MVTLPSRAISQHALLVPSVSNLTPLFLDLHVGRVAPSCVCVCLFLLFKCLKVVRVMLKIVCLYPFWDILVACCFPGRRDPQRGIGCRFGLSLFGIRAGGACPGCRWKGLLKKWMSSSWQIFTKTWFDMDPPSFNQQKHTHTLR